MSEEIQSGSSTEDLDGQTVKGSVDPNTNVDELRSNINAKLENPLRGFTTRELAAKGEAYCRDNGISDEEDIRAFRLGAVIAQNFELYADCEGLTPDENDALESEIEHKWRQPWYLWLIVILCSICAAVQGMDETVVNGAQIFYSIQFGIGNKTSSRDSWLVGLVNSAPYLCCALIGCWLTVPMNKYLGRRGTVFWTCVISAVACFAQAFTNNWWGMFVARFVLGFGIGPKSATVPIYAAECAPPKIRGALVMQWQMWTAFGIMLGFVADLAFYHVPDRSGIIGLNWRLMMGSAMFPAVIVCCFVFMCPESPRWYMSKNRHQKAYQSMCSLRYNKIQAARDIFYMHTLLEIEKETMVLKKNPILELIKVPRNRRAFQASEIVMFMQQFCGVNVIAYYSSEIFLESGFDEIRALSASLGFGIINFLFALPAVWTIDRFGRRNLLLTTFPIMSLCLFFTGFSFWIPEGSTAKVACIALGIYIFGIFYSPGPGPVPFTYSAEAYPLYIRPLGMSCATATTWFFNFVLSITWPSLLKAFKPQGAFSWYACWNIIGFLGVLFFVPETKGRSLEELDQVFSVRTRDHAAYGARQVGYFINRYILRKDVEPEDLYALKEVEHRPDSYQTEKPTDPVERV
ncbi:MFS general substrate transporter [Glarea lozoyensis ATCC 20868]|uniref:MFS general substrate transporter n=1 Tax=Glarea lozoyensis (strain ATCC 20868 / MF5171) TaxID=1116229 RepID=S3DL88_GLAL2|nr:MFS general substrate transporter [Glarea lozoyensis ATCC 20868]EPE27308.1 MFS general substrate transporter [Glarea lozoyensis ATCC 20868]